MERRQFLATLGLLAAPSVVYSFPSPRFLLENAAQLEIDAAVRSGAMCISGRRWKLYGPLYIPSGFIVGECHIDASASREVPLIVGPGSTVVNCLVEVGTASHAWMHATGYIEAKGVRFMGNLFRRA